MRAIDTSPLPLGLFRTRIYKFYEKHVSGGFRSAECPDRKEDTIFNYN